MLFDRDYFAMSVLKKLICLGLIVTFVLPTITIAAPDDVDLDTCESSELFSSKLVTDVCWECMFPITIAGFRKSGDIGVPPGGVGRSNFICSCEDNFGISEPGFITSMWEPARIVEITRDAGCSPSLGGIRLPLTDKFRRGAGKLGRNEREVHSTAFYHYHYFAFPAMILLEMLVTDSCNVDGYVDFDLLYFSEVDPTWNNEELAFFTQPEAIIAANPAAQLACSAEGAAIGAGSWPVNQLYWCAGAWGSIYPFSGFTHRESFADRTSLLATRAIAALHRRGLALKSYGSDAKCKGIFAPMLPKSQYKMSFFSPRAEKSSSHKIGQPSHVWGAGRVVPGKPEDATFVVFRYNDCCLTN